MINIEWKSVEEHGWPGAGESVVVTDGYLKWISWSRDTIDGMVWVDTEITHYADIVDELVPSINGGLVNYADVLDQIKLPGVE